MRGTMSYSLFLSSESGSVPGIINIHREQQKENGGKKIHTDKHSNSVFNPDSHLQFLHFSDNHYILHSQYDNLFIVYFPVFKYKKYLKRSLK